MNQGFDQKAVFDVDTFVPAYRDFKLLITKYITSVFEFVAPDITFVQDLVSGADFS